MNDEIKEILDNIKCPQLGYDEYGKWGALPLNVRMTLKRLCDYVVSSDDYITNLQQDNEMYAQLKDEYEEEIKDLQQDLDKANEIIIKDRQFNQGRLLDLAKLKEENERLKNVLNCKEYFSSTMPEDTEFVILTKNNYDRQQKDIQFELIDYKSRCEKAVEMLKEIHKILPGTYNQLLIEITQTLNILQNGSDKNDE